VAVSGGFDRDEMVGKLKSCSPTGRSPAKKPAPNPDRHNDGRAGHFNIVDKGT